MELSVELKDYIRDIPDFPTPGILFRDITPLLKAPAAFAEAISALTARYSRVDIDAVVGIDARGFLLAAPVALRMERPVIPVRKQGKLPYETHSVTYQLEYGVDSLEMHRDAIMAGARVLIVDDLLATGGTLTAAAELVERAGGLVAGFAVLIELTALNGRARLAGYDLHTLVRY